VNSAQVSGVSCADLVMVVQPAASAAPALRTIISNGKFHGVMRRHGPTGWWLVTTRNPPCEDEA
jgi:hypothetical protein